MMIRHYLQIIKPQITLSSMISIIGGGSMAASKVHINFNRFFIIIFGITLVVASGCVFNNLIDRDIDKKMNRTQNRALVIGSISPRIGFIYGTILGIVGLFLLYMETNILTLMLSIVGFFWYVVLYSIYIKRKSIYSTLVGSISGAIPPVAGYCAMSNKFDMGAIFLLLIFCFWQIPHFYAIAILHSEDYQSASIPIFPIKKGMVLTKRHMYLYIIGLIVAVSMLTFFGYTSYNYLLSALLIMSLWLRIALAYAAKQVDINEDKVWARKLFIYSIIVITALSTMMLVESFFWSQH